jgi:hypothetical protein
MTKHESLRAAQHAVMLEIGYIQKKGRVSGSYGYTYAGEKELINELRPVMLEHGIVMYPDVCEVIKTEDYTTSRGNRMSMFLGKRRFVFEHVDTGDQAYVEVFAEAADQGDKRASKAMTLAKKYALREFFLIETGDDPDAEVSPRAKSDNVYNRALMAIESSTTIEELNDKWSSINSYQDVVWKGDQVSKLLTAVEKKKEQLAGVTDD